jgi:photosystem II stability/assembly factor-like uncharacterized protein
MRKIFYILIPVLFLQFSAIAQPWKLIDTSSVGNFINVHFWDANNGIISGQLSGRFLKTHDGGASWDTIQVPYQTQIADYRTDMQFLNNQYGFVCGGSGFSTIQNMLLGTKDGGETWDSLIINWPFVYEFMGLDFRLTSNIKGIVFTYGSMYKTLDSGKSLSQVPLPSTPFYLIDAVLVDNNIVLAGNTGFGTNNKIYVSADWGANWVNVFDDTLAITALGANGHNLYAACGSGWVIKSVNGGNSWTKSKIAANAMNFNKVRFGANDYVYMTANVNGDSYVYGSDNNGNTWHSQIIDGNNYWAIDVSMPTKDTGYALSYVRIYKTVTGGGLQLSVSNLSPVIDDIRAYPSPANDKLHIDAGAGIKVKSLELYDITGKLVKRQTTDVQQIEVSSLVRGEYLIKIETDKCSSVKKLLVQ